MRLKIDRVTHYETDSKGNQLVSKKTNKPYSRCVIQSGDKRYSGFGSQTTRDWKQGDEIEVEITQNGEYLNFRLPPQTVGREEFNNLKFEVKSLEARIQSLEPSIPEQVDEVFEDLP